MRTAAWKFTEDLELIFQNSGWTEKAWKMERTDITWKLVQD